MTLRHYQPRWASVAGLAIAAATSCLLLSACSASRPGTIETLVAQEAKRVAIAGSKLKNPLPDTADNVKAGQDHFAHHCQICHGLDGHNTGVPFAGKMSPEVADLGGKNVQEYSDGQLKMIIQNGIRFSGMPGWQGILDDDDMWRMVIFIRHLPPAGSLGAPAVYKEAEEEHEHEHEHH
jgi:mono/diheme cytochrome c family protein